MTIIVNNDCKLYYHILDLSSDQNCQWVLTRIVKLFFNNCHNTKYKPSEMIIIVGLLTRNDYVKVVTIIVRLCFTDKKCHFLSIIIHITSWHMTASQFKSQVKIQKSSWVKSCKMKMTWKNEDHSINKDSPKNEAYLINKPF